MKDNGCLIIVAIVAVCLVGILVLSVFSPASNQWASQSNSKMFPDSVSSAEPTPLPEISPNTWKALGWLIVIIIVFFVLRSIVQGGGGPALALFVIAVVFFGAMFWVIAYRGGDISTYEARDENLQVVRVIQPVGDPESDLLNSETNKMNASANVVNAGSFSIYLAGGWITIILIVFGGIFLMSAIKAKTG